MGRRQSHGWTRIRENRVAAKKHKSHKRRQDRGVLSTHSSSTFLCLLCFFAAHVSSVFIRVSSVSIRGSSSCRESQQAQRQRRGGDPPVVLERAGGCEGDRGNGGLPQQEESEQPRRVREARGAPH